MIPKISNYMRGLFKKLGEIHSLLA
jgi:hypothetical protein